MSARKKCITRLSILFLTCSIFILHISTLKGQSYQLTFEGKKHLYTVHLPPDYTLNRKYSLVLNFSGLISTAAKEEQYSQMNVVADKEQFIIVYPEAYHRGWNTGIGFGSYTHGKNDIGFINALLDTLIHSYSINIQCIYSVGISIGGFFNYRVACELSNRIAAMASVSGLMTDSTLTSCHPCRDIPILHFHGTKDPIIKYKGIKRQSLSVEQTLNVWIMRNHCTIPGDTIHIPDMCLSDHSTVDLIKYTSCTNGSEVWLYKIYGGGHTWPGGGKQSILMGHKNMDINGSQAVWDFFKRFTLTTGSYN
jgi:polyhydroxybutyrate depolymerase